MIELTQTNADEILSRGGVQVVVFYSPTCVHCKRTEAGIEAIEQESATTAEFVRCNIADEPYLAERYDVTALPTLLFLDAGEVKNKLVGFTHKLVIEDQLKRIG